MAFSTCNQKLAGIRFFYRQVLGQDGFDLRVPAKRSGRLPEPPSRSQIARLVEATQNSKHFHRFQFSLRQPWLFAEMPCAGRGVPPSVSPSSGALLASRTRPLSGVCPY